VSDPRQQQVFLYLKMGLKAYKSRRADPDSWVLGGYATKEVIDRAKFQPALVGDGISSEDVAFLGVDPGPEIDEAWWDDMLVAWFGAPDEDEGEESLDVPEQGASTPDAEKDSARPSPSATNI
jgi:hypothetical protein